MSLNVCVTCYTLIGAGTSFARPSLQPIYLLCTHAHTTHGQTLPHARPFNITCTPVTRTDRANTSQLLTLHNDKWGHRHRKVIEVHLIDAMRGLSDCWLPSDRLIVPSLDTTLLLLEPPRKLPLLLIDSAPLLGVCASLSFSLSLRWPSALLCHVLYCLNLLAAQYSSLLDCVPLSTVVSCAILSRRPCCTIHSQTPLVTPFILILVETDFVLSSHPLFWNIYCALYVHTYNLHQYWRRKNIFLYGGQHRQYIFNSFYYWGMNLYFSSISTLICVYNNIYFLFSLIFMLLSCICSYFTFHRPWFPVFDFHAAWHCQTV
jgi:hypothetical protein